jgi:PadR family transcriptional regulator, regulatory protein PadR
VVVAQDDGSLTQLRRGVLPHAVLAVLADGERYGVELVQLLSADTRLAVSEGTLYPLLARLRRDGLVATRWRESTAGPPRRYHHLTPEGAAALDAFRTEWRGFRTAVDALFRTDAPTETSP